MQLQNTSTTMMLLSEPAVVAGLVILILIGIVAILSNSLLLLLYAKHQDLRNKATTFVIHLGLTDLLTGVFVMMFVILQVTDERAKSYVMCLASREVYMYLNNVSKFFILAATFERYMGICQRERYTKVLTTKITRCIILCSWILPIPLALPPLFGDNYWIDAGACNLPDIIPDWLLTVHCTLTIILILFSVVFYANILMKAREIYRRVHPTPFIALNAYSTQVRSIRNGKVVGFVTVLFLACWLPRDVVTVFYVLGFRKLNNFVSEGGTFLGLSNSAMNPFLYAWQKREFRNNLRKMMCPNQQNVRENQTMVQLIDIGNVAREPGFTSRPG